MYSIGAGANTGTNRFTRRRLQMQKALCVNVLMGAQLMLSGGFSTTPGDSWQHIMKD